MGCVLMIVIIVLGWIAFNVLSGEAERKRSVIEGYIYEIKSLDKQIEEDIKQIEFLMRAYFKSKDSGVDYIKSQINDLFKEIKSNIDKMEYQNNCLKRVTQKENYDEDVKFYKINAYPEIKEKVNTFSDFLRKLEAVQVIIDCEEYGKVNEERLSIIKSMKRDTIVQSIEECSNLLDKNPKTQDDLTLIYQINIAEILSYIWFFATEKVYSATDFAHAKELFSKFYKKEHIEVIVAELYAKKKVGGEDALRDSIRELLKSNRDAETLTKIASGLMWMKAYQAEAMVLKHMLENGMEMSQKAQERLQVLSNGSGNAPDGFNVKSENDNLYFDVSSLTWREEEYKGFFDNLAFRDSNLTYSLTIRDEDKELFISQGVQVPADSDILKKLREVFEEEYGSSVVSRQVEATALSGSGEERLKGILIYSEECSQMGIFVHLVKIGKKVDIKFYTLLMPENVSAEDQLQKALSLQKKLSPTVNMWEGSLKETTLMGIQQLLNKENQSTSKKTENDSAHKNVNSDEPVF